MSAPGVSIIVPVYNSGAFLMDCLETIVGQTMSDFEVLLVDDGSTDDSLAICRRFERHDSRFRVFSQENAGAAAARNLALTNARGEWVMFIDSDDLIEDDCIERLIKVAEVSGSDIVLGGYCTFKSDPFDCETVVPDCDGAYLSPADVLAMILYQDGLDTAPWGKIFRRELFDGVSFPSLRSSEDLATVYKLFLRASCVALVRDSGYRYRQVAGSLSYSKQEAEAWYVMRDAAYEILSRFPELYLPCCCRRLSFAFHVFLISDDVSVRRKTWKEIVATRRDVLFDQKARKKARIAAAVSFLGQRATHTIGNMMHFSR